MSQENDEKDVENIIDETKNQDRTTTEPSVQTVEDEPDLDEAAAEAYEALDNGDLAPNITVRDERLAGLFEALDETDGIREIEQAANEAVGRDVESEGNKASLARALLRVGFQEVDPGAFEDAKSGYNIYLDKQKAEQTSNF